MALSGCAPCCDPSQFAKSIDSYRQAELIILCDILAAVEGGGGAGNPAAPNRSVQFNNGGVFGGSANLTWNEVPFGILYAAHPSELQLRLEVTAGVKQRLWLFGPGVGVPDGSFGIRDETVTTNRITIDLNGNVGIGTITPFPYLLNVNGDINAGNALYYNAFLKGSTHYIQEVVLDPVTSVFIDTGALYTKDVAGITQLFYRENADGAVHQLTPPGGGSPAAPDTSIQFNNAGSFGGSANFTWNTGSNILSVNGLIFAQGGSASSTYASYTGSDQLMSNDGYSTDITVVHPGIASVGVGVTFRHQGANGSANAIIGQGVSDTATSPATGVRGVGRSLVATNYGVQGFSILDNPSDNYGVYGQGDNASTGDAYGVVGLASTAGGSGTPYAVFGDCPGTGVTYGWAGYFARGDVATENKLGWRDNAGLNFTFIQGPAAFGADIVWVLPSAQGGAGSFLSNDGGGILSWIVGASGTFTSADAKTITVVNGLITSIV